MQVSLKTATLLVASLLLLSCTFAQSKQEVFGSIQKLLNKAVGEKIKTDNIFAKDPDKLTRQTFTENEVTVIRKPADKKDYQWVTRASNIPWNDLFDYSIFTEYENSDVQIVKINFKKTYKREYYPSKDDGSDIPSTSTSLEVYVLTKDKKEMELLLTRLYELREKKAEPAFLTQVKSFTKEQTLSWLNTNLLKYMRLGTYDTEGRIASFDACKLVVTYRSLVRNYEEVLPVDIKGLTKYGKLEYSGAKASIRTTTPDSFDKGEKKFNRYSSAVYISYADEDMLLSIEAALKHLATFCTGTASPTTTSPTTTSTTTTSTTTTTTKTTGSPGTAGTSGTSGTAAVFQPKLTGSTEQWYYTFYKGKTMGLQSWVTDKIDFPDAKVQEKWKQGYYIIDVAYGGPSAKYYVAFSKMPGYTDQLWRARYSRKDIMADIDASWKTGTGYRVTNLVFIDGIWRMVATQGTPIKEQLYFFDDVFPEEKIKNYWGQGYDITDMVYGPEGWLIVMSQGYNYVQRYKKLETSNEWNNQIILDYKKEGYYLSHVCKAGNAWYMLFNKDAKVTAAEYHNTDSFKAGTVTGMWDQFFYVDKVIYVPAR